MKYLSRLVVNGGGKYFFLFKRAKVVTFKIMDKKAGIICHSMIFTDFDYLF